MKIYNLAVRMQLKCAICKRQHLIHILHSILVHYNNVLYTKHTAFYTHSTFKLNLATLNPPKARKTLTLPLPGGGSNWPPPPTVFSIFYKKSSPQPITKIYVNSYSILVVTLMLWSGQKKKFWGILSRIHLIWFKVTIFKMPF